MPAAATHRIEAAIAAATGSDARIVGTQPVSGGCIGDSRLLTLADGRRLFVKQARASQPPDVFACEFEALELLAQAQAVRVPQPIACGRDFIVLEAFAAGRPRRDWQQQMGRALAALHRAAQAPQFGFPRDNYLGVTAQPNAWCDDWLSFWRERRLVHQLELFAARAGIDDRLARLGYRLAERLDRWLDVDAGPPVLLHGDLWSGNAAADASGVPIIFDPASYYGHREAEFGMMRLFGGFGPECEQAYAEVWPFAAGADERIALYRLYHELNHLNLFGGSYYPACLRTLESLT